MPYTIYLRTNLVNGKQYVGQTCDFRKRESQWNCLKARYANQYIVAEREKYGVENFKCEIIAEVETREDAWELERHYIEELNTVYPNGYNRAYGGKTNVGGNKGYHNGNEFKKGSEPWNKNLKGIHLSPDTEFKGKSVVQLKDGLLIKEWNSAILAERELGIKRAAISACCRKVKHRKTAGGFEWMFKEDYEKMLTENHC